jgi:hypothetical protein
MRTELGHLLVLALARPNIILWIPTRLKAAQLFGMPLFEKVG